MTGRNQLIASICSAQLIHSLPREAAETTAQRIRVLIREGNAAFSIPADLPDTADRIAAAVSTSKGNALIGAAAVTDSDIAREAILSGADFVSTPYLDAEIVRLCHRYGKVCIPGALSVTEVLHAVESGCGLVGMYPAQLFGPQLLQAVRGPLPQAHLVASGGIEMHEAEDWIDAGAAAVEVEIGNRC